MARVPVMAFGRLSLEYQAYGKPHVARLWVNEFTADAGVGTFAVPGTPASLDALATAATAMLGSMFSSDSAVSWGAWRGEMVTNHITGSGIPIVEGTITPGAFSMITGNSAAKAVGQMTYAFRDSAGHLMRFVLVGAYYAGPNPYLPSSVSGAYAGWRDYVTASIRIVSRGANQIASMIDVTFDTNDGLTRKYRR